ncbi:MAG: hypothetical protein F6K24_37600, partial [Okeania sp. SIO2D1]|nr:hypothetical protein [Okeania sp. SIO2D1]
MGKRLCYNIRTQGEGITSVKTATPLRVEESRVVAQAQRREYVNKIGLLSTQGEDITSVKIAVRFSLTEESRVRLVIVIVMSRKRNVGSMSRKQVRNS